MKRKYVYRLAGLIIIALVLAIRAGWINDQKSLKLGNLQPGFYSINHFVDGDTIAVNMNGHTEDIRFIGIDTPETHKPNTPVECYGPQAAAFTKSQIGVKPVRLVSDSLSTDRDRYDRLLRYVYLTDGTNLNEELVQKGYAFYYPYFPFSKSDQFAADEKAAQNAKLGLWNSCHPTPSDDGGYKMDELAS